MSEHEDSSHLKEQFEAIVKENFDYEEADSSEILNQIAALQAQAATIKQTFEVEQKKVEFIKKREQEKREELRKLTEQRLAIESGTRDAHRKLSQFDVEINQLRRELERKKMQELANREFKEAAQRFLDEAINRPWYNSALQHQTIGAQSLAFAKRGFLGDYMGLGKTLTSIIWADFVKAHRVLVLAPKETCNSFVKELGKWADDRMCIPLIAQPKAIRDGMFQIMNHAKPDQFIIVANMETWRRDKEFIKDIIEQKIDAVIIDEAHGIKNKKSDAFKGIKEIVYAHNQCFNCGGQSFRNYDKFDESRNYYYPYWECQTCYEGSFKEVDICSVKYLLAMTGTPILNRPQELWPILHLIDRSLYPNENDFLFDFCWQDVISKRWKFRRGGIEDLAKRVGKMFVMRDYKSAGIKIPEQQVHEYNIEFNRDTAPEQWEAYRYLAEHELLKLGDKEVMHVQYKIVLMTRFRQMVTYPEGIEIKDSQDNVLYRCPVTQSLKLEFAIEKIKELLATGEKVVLFSQFKKPLHVLQERLNGYLIESDDGDIPINSVILDGSTPDNLKDEIRLYFDKSRREERGYKDKWNLLLANYKVGGQSSTFTECIHTVILDEEWNPGKRNQAYGRTARIGQDQETIVHLIKLKNDYVEIIDEYIANLMREKENMTEGFEEAAKKESESILSILRKTQGM